MSKNRVIGISRDEGSTVDKIYIDKSLPDPYCQGSVLRYDDKRILFCNAASQTRNNLTVRVSENDGDSWAVSKVLNPGKSAYSDLAINKLGDILCIYEGGDDDLYDCIRICKFDIDWIYNKEQK
jgi:hypothetical protein